MVVAVDLACARRGKIFGSGLPEVSRTRVEALWGCGDIEDLFLGAPKAVVPWPGAGQRRKTAGEERAALRELLAGPPLLAEVDPRELVASQTWVVRHHAAYYRTPIWEKTCTTSADMPSAANRYPVISDNVAGRKRIVTGHHRALAALVEGRPLMARLTSSTQQSPAMHASPRIRIDGSGTGAWAHTAVDAAEAVASAAVTVADWEVALGVLRLLGLDEAQVEDRRAMGQTGRILLGR